MEAGVLTKNFKFYLQFAISRYAGAMPVDTSEKLDTIISHLERMDRRDRLRTIGGFVRSLITLVPAILFILSALYLYRNFDDVLERVTAESAKQAAAMAGDNSFMKGLEKYMPKKK